MTELKDILSKMASVEEEDRALVTSAYEFAAKAHEGHTRRSGEPYITHPAAIAATLAEMGMSAKTIAAGLLHDVIEDTPATAKEVGDAFGEEVLFLVEGVTKLGKVRYYGSDRHNESLRKLFVATSEDIRVVIVKLVDRLHNMQTLDHVSPEKQLRIAQETLEIYAPVAHRLGMGRIRKELEDLAFPYVYPKEHARVGELTKPLMKNALERLEKAQKSLQKKLAGNPSFVNFKTHSRVKGTYSLFRKLERKDWDIDQIHDLIAIRLIVPTVEDCYYALGIVHSLWRPLPRRMKDYIAFPKPNGYQSLHTTVITHDGQIMEIQIRTELMHRESEYGVASHLSYKQKQTGGELSSTQNRLWVMQLIPSLFRPISRRIAKVTKTDGPTEHPTDIYTRDQVPHWIQEIAEAHKASRDTGDFVHDLRTDFFSHRIFVFTPRGDVVDLPLSATPVDFAYAIHSDIGDHTTGAKVNNKFVQLDTELHNGDIVEIITGKKSTPTRRWLEFAKTSLAQRRIRGATENNDQRPR